MPRKRTTAVDLGELDGRPIDGVVVKLKTTTGRVDERLKTGQRIVLLVEAFVGPAVTVSEEEGKLIKAHTAAPTTVVMIDQVDEQLYRMTTDYLIAFVERSTGEVRLPLDDDEPAPDPSDADVPPVDNEPDVDGVA